jgi:hypothetical protein
MLNPDMRGIARPCDIRDRIKGGIGIKKGSRWNTMDGWGELERIWERREIKVEYNGWRKEAGAQHSRGRPLPPLCSVRSRGRRGPSNEEKKEICHRGVVAAGRGLEGDARLAS